MLNENTEVFLVNNDFSGCFYYFLYILRNKYAIVSFDTAANNSDAVFFLINNKKSISHYQKITETICDHSSPLFTRHYFNSNTEYINDLVGMYTSKDSIYRWDYPVPLFLCGSDYVWQIFEQNAIDKEKAEHFLETYKVLHSMSIKCHTRYFVNLDYLSDIIASDYLEITHWSHMCGQNIVVNRELFLQLLQESVRIFSTDESVEIGILSDPYPIDYSNLEFHVHKEQGVFFRSVNRVRQVAMFCDDRRCVENVYKKFSDMWEELPILNRQKEYVIRKITQLIEKEQTHNT